MVLVRERLSRSLVPPTVMSLGLALLPSGCGAEAARRPAVESTLLPGPPDGVAVPPPGSFHVRWIAPLVATAAGRVPGIFDGWGEFPWMAYVQVDYAGPRPLVELAVVNEEGESTSEKTLIRFPYGATIVTRTETRTRAGEGRPCTHPRQTFCLRWYSLPACGDNNSLLSLETFPADTQDFLRGYQVVFHVSAFEAESIDDSGSRSFGELAYHQAPGPGDPFMGPRDAQFDSDTVTLLECRAGAITSRIVMRFVE